jgi:hypothetical protein
MQQGRPQNAIAWSIIAAIAAVDAIWIAVSDFEFVPFGAAGTAAATAAAGVALWYYGVHRPEERIAATVAGVTQLILYTAVGAPLSYLCASIGLPFWDATLHGWDLALGLDWRAYLAWVNDRPVVGAAFAIAYASLIPQMIVVCLVLGFTGRILQLRVFLLATVVSGLLCIVISAAMPAMAMYVHLGLGPADYPNLSPGASFVHVSDMTGLRDGSLRILNLPRMEGIITFPSYHAALGVILAAALWSVPLLRWPGLLLNAQLIAATPIDGGHYFTDVGAGMAVAGLCLAAARSLRQGSGARAAGEVLPVRA